jgi:hypothetical protein
MFPNWTGWKTVKALLFSAVTIDGVFVASNAFSQTITHDAAIVSLFLGAAGVIVTTLSGTNAGPTMAANVTVKGPVL